MTTLGAALAPLVNARPRTGGRALALPIAVALGSGLYLAAAAPLRAWLIDDAGISFAYARDIAAGYGPVGQPGAPPVEGFSNPLWTLLLAGLFRVGLFDVAWTPKAVSFGLVLATFGLVASRLQRGGTTWPAAWVVAVLGTSASFVIWTTSGLENPLLAFLATAACAAVAQALEGGRGAAAAAGGLAALLALTRPDAALYVFAFPATLLWTAVDERRRPRDAWGRAASYVVGFAPLTAAYLAYRRAEFGAWVPNTYYAKDKPSLVFLLDGSKWSELAVAALGPLGVAAALALAIGIAALARRRALTAGEKSLAVHLALATGAYLCMPLDWMGEYRFGTAVFVFFYWALGAGLSRAWSAGKRRAALAAAAVLATGGVACQLPRLEGFAGDPVVPFAGVADFYGRGFDQLARALGDAPASLLAPDMGGTLFYSHLRAHDLVGLCDRTIARTLTRDTSAFHRYALGVLRPTFIHVHRGWAQWAAFHSSPAFRAAYVPIHETWAAGDEPVSGDYVRRDALGADPVTALARLQQAYAAAGMDLKAF